MEAVGREYTECDNPACREESPPLRCTRCRKAYYCNADCQHQHWREHWRECVAARYQCGDPACPNRHPPMKCSRCRMVYYCNAECQRRDWHEHKRDCQVPVSRRFIACENPACGKPSPTKKCSRCQLSYYCDTDCALQNWKAHKPHCRDIDSQLATLAWIGAPVSRAPVRQQRRGRGPCGICLQADFIAPMMALPCGHAYCFPCISGYYQLLRVVRSTAGTGASGCPECRSEGLSREFEWIEQALFWAARMKINRDRSTRSEYAMLVDVQLKKMMALKKPPPGLFSLLAAVNVAAGELKQAPMNLDMEIQNHIKTVKKIKISKARQAEIASALAVARDERMKTLLNEALERSKENTVSLGPYLTDEARFDVQLKLGEAKAAVHDWKGAKKSYEDLYLSSIDENPSTDLALHPSNKLQECEMFMGLTRCCLHLKQYDQGVKYGLRALNASRTFPGVHGLLTEAQEASGRVDAAKRTASRGLFHEMPWDPESVWKAKVQLEALKDC